MILSLIMTSQGHDNKRSPNIYSLFGSSTFYFCIFVGFFSITKWPVMSRHRALISLMFYLPDPFFALGGRA